MATWIIKKDGTGDVTSISQFIANAQPGDTGIISDSGTYQESVVCNIENITLTVAKGCSPVWYATSENLRVMAPGMRVIGPPGGYLTMVGGGINYPCITGNSVENLQVIRVRSYYSQGQYERSTFMSFDGLTNCLVEDCIVDYQQGRIGFGVTTISGMTIRGCRFDVGTFIRTNSFTNLDVERCLVKVADYCMSSYASTYSWAGQNRFVNVLVRETGDQTTGGLFKPFSTMYAQTGSSMEFSHCTIVRDQILQSGSRVALIFWNSDDRAQLILRNSLIAGFPVGVSASSSWSPDYCHIALCVTPYAGYASRGAHDVDPTLDPRFAAYGSDYHLLDGSPDIDAGADLSVMVDLDNKRRPQGRGYDIGCYEYIPPVVYAPLPGLEVTVLGLDGMPLPGYKPLSPGGVGPRGLAHIADIVLTTLFTDKPARTKHETYEGWWADAEWGSLLWSLIRGPVKPVTVEMVKEYIKSALQYYVDEHVVDRVVVDGYLTMGGVAFEVTVYSGKEGVRIKWHQVWEEP